MVVRIRLRSIWNLYTARSARLRLPGTWVAEQIPQEGTERNLRWWKKNSYNKNCMSNTLLKIFLQISSINKKMKISVC
jgi:hypothetical protein